MPSSSGRLRTASDDSDYLHGASIFEEGGMTRCPGFETGVRGGGYAPAISSPRRVPVPEAEAKRSVSRPRRCRAETNRFGRG